VSEGAGKAHEKRKIQAIKGVRDILPPETALWNRVEQTAREVFATYGFGEIRLPIFEQTELFARSVGAETDIVTKEMYPVEAHPLEKTRETIRDIGSFSNDPDRLVYAILSFKFCDDALAYLNRGEISRTSENVNLLAQFEEKRPGIEAVLYGGENDPSRIQSVSTFMRNIALGIDVGPDLSLRPEATASVCRAYIEHGMHPLPGNVKLYCMGPMFRRERPQKGRYRQFYQIDAEVLSHTGDLKEDARVDAEVIEMLTTFFEKTGLEGTALYLNSIGCKECRPKYVELLRAALTKVKDKLGTDSQRRIETNPLRVLDSKLESEQAIIEKLPRITEHLCAACREQYAEVKKQLALRNLSLIHI